MASPAMVFGAAGNALASTTLAASGTTNFNVDFSAVFEGHLQIGATFGTVATTAGLKVEVFPRVGSTPVNDTDSSTGGAVTAVASSARANTFKLQTGRYHVVLTNLDATNGLTAVSATYDTISSVS